MKAKLFTATVRKNKHSSSPKNILQIHTNSQTIATVKAIVTEKAEVQNSYVSLSQKSSSPNVKIKTGTPPRKYFTVQR